jgi:Flp pilus assembly pilin Flp
MWNPEELPMLKAYVFAQTAIGSVKDRVAALRRDESGAALIEYSLLIGLIVVGAVVAMTAVGTKIGADWNDLKTKIGA